MHSLRPQDTFTYPEYNSTTIQKTTVRTEFIVYASKQAYTKTAHLGSVEKIFCKEKWSKRPENDWENTLSEIQKIICPRL